MILAYETFWPFLLGVEEGPDDGPDWLELLSLDLESSLFLFLDPDLKRDLDLCPEVGESRGIWRLYPAGLKRS